MSVRFVGGSGVFGNDPRAQVVGIKEYCEVCEREDAISECQL